MKTTALILEDDTLLANLIAKSVSHYFKHCQVCHTLDDAFEYVDAHTISLAILDLSLPDGSALSLLKHFYQESPQTKLLVVTSSPQVQQRLEAYDSGALDVISKPCNLVELEQKVKRWQKCWIQPLQSELGFYTKVNDAVLDYSSNTFSPENLFRPQEYKVFQCLLHNAGRVLSKEQIIRFAWGSAGAPTPETIEVYIKRIREKLPSQFVIETKRGFGYVYYPPSK